MKITEKSFGETRNGLKVNLFLLSNDNGMKVSITNYGGIITSILVPDRFGELGDVVLGYDKLLGYLNDDAYIGAIVGRYANRIKNGQIKIDGESYSLSANENEHTLHGGIEGFNQKVWDAEMVSHNKWVALILRYTSADGENGFPGELECEVKFTLFDDNRLRIDYTCSTNKTTHINLTHHDYFNLRDGGVTTVLDHKLYVNADYFTECDAENIPTGKLRSVDQSSMDWRCTEKIEDQMLRMNGKNGFDHNYVLNKENNMSSAILKDPQSGRTMEVWTDQPGMQIYTAGHLSNRVGKSSIDYGPFHGICLEGQHFPDSPNNPNFPSTLLRTDEIYTQFYEMRFYTDSQVNSND